MSKTYNEDMTFAGGLSAGNIAWGYVKVKPEVGSVNNIDVTGLNLAGEGELYPQVQVHTAFPWTSCGNPTVASTTESLSLWDGDKTSFRICFVRVNKSETWISWFVWRGVT
jgi:hypothetical protein